MATRNKIQVATDEAAAQIGEYEEVDHPPHYNDHPKGIECIDVIEDFPHNIGAAMKYLWRAGLKPGAETDKDLRKCIWYVERERNRLAQQ